MTERQCETVFSEQCKPVTQRLCEQVHYPNIVTQEYSPVVQEMSKKQCSDTSDLPLLNMSEDCSNLGGGEVSLLPIQEKGVATCVIESLVEGEDGALQDLDITMPMQQDCSGSELSRPPRTSTPIPDDDRAEPDFSSLSIIKEHSYHVSSFSVTGVLKNRGCPLASFMQQNWAETRFTKNPLKKTSPKSKKIVNPKRKVVYTKDQLSVATNILYSSKRVYRMLRAKKLLELPGISTVYRHLQRFKCRPGMNHEMKRLLNLFLLSLDPQDRICGVLFDEMKLSQLMSWSARLMTVFKPHKVGRFNKYLSSNCSIKSLLECSGSDAARAEEGLEISAHV